MPLIKNKQSSRLLKNAMVLDLGDLKKQGDRILQQARDEANTILAEARDEARRLVDAADERGYQQGFERGMNEGREKGRGEGRETALQELKPQLEEINAAWRQTLADWEQQRNTMLLTAREDVLSFAFALGEQIVRRVIEYDPTVVTDQLAECLSVLAGPTSIAVHVNPEDRPIIEEALPDLLSDLDQKIHATVRETPELQRGGCRISFKGGHIDATLERQIERLAIALLPWADPPVAEPVEEAPGPTADQSESATDPNLREDESP